MENENFQAACFSYGVFTGIRADQLMGCYFSHQIENLTRSCQHIYFNNDVCMHATCIYVCIHATCMHVYMHISLRKSSLFIVTYNFSTTKNVMASNCYIASSC